MANVTLRLVLPRLGADMTRARIECWHMAAGDRVEYGDDLFDVVVEDITRLRRSASARKSARERRGRAKFRTLTGQHVRFRISSLDVGTLVHVEVGPQQKVTEGDLVGYLSEPDGVIEASGVMRPTARLVVNRVESEFDESD